MDYTVRVEVEVTADSPEEAAKYALDDLRDKTIGPVTMEVTCEHGKKTVSVGDPDGDEPEVIYLTSATGEETGYGKIELNDAAYAKVAFEQGPGCVLPYIVEIDGIAHVLGNLEVAHKDVFWGEDGGDFQSEDETRAYCQAACDYIRTRLTSGMQLLSLDEGMPGRIIVRVAIELDGLSDSEATSKALRQAFGEMAELPDVVPAT